MARRTFPRLGKVERFSLGHAVLEGTLQELGLDLDVDLGSRIGRRAVRSMQVHLLKPPVVEYAMAADIVAMSRQHQMDRARDRQCIDQMSRIVRDGDWGARGLPTRRMATANSSQCWHEVAASLSAVAFCSHCVRRTSDHACVSRIAVATMRSLCAPCTPAPVETAGGPARLRISASQRLTASLPVPTDRQRAATAFGARETVGPNPLWTRSACRRDQCGIGLSERHGHLSVQPSIRPTGGPQPPMASNGPRTLAHFGMPRVISRGYKSASARTGTMRRGRTAGDPYCMHKTKSTLLRKGGRVVRSGCEDTVANLNTRITYEHSWSSQRFTAPSSVRNLDRDLSRYHRRIEQAMVGIGKNELQSVLARRQIEPGLGLTTAIMQMVLIRRYRLVRVERLSNINEQMVMSTVRMSIAGVCHTHVS